MILFADVEEDWLVEELLLVVEEEDNEVELEPIDVVGLEVLLDELEVVSGDVLEDVDCEEDETAVDELLLVVDDDVPSARKAPAATMIKTITMTTTRIVLAIASVRFILPGLKWKSDLFLSQEIR